MIFGRISRLFSLLALFGAGLLVSACAGEKKDTYVERPVEELYNAAQDDISRGDYAKAAKDFDEVDRQHPYSVWATKAQLMAAYSLYHINKYDDAILAAERYKQLHPGNKDVAYAYYLIAICYYEQIADVGRDQKITDQALSALQEVIRRFPNTEYARDAKLKLDLARDHLAGKEMAVGRYYLTRGEYLAAINRFRVVVDKYQTTTHVPEALERLTECYLALGIVDEAETTAAVLGHNYPGSDWYQYSYAMLTGQHLRPAEASDSWMTRVWDSVF
jgi:outer membrane protein assembly factor BamD